MKRKKKEPEFLPTSAAPGSEEKKRVIAWRSENGFPLFHPDDNYQFDSTTRKQKKDIVNQISRATPKIGMFRSARRLG